ncbi:MAG: ABC transporter permease [Actinobacteria bacterium]|nr:ABC transporter permease [Actinomycetota bacterium]
MGRYVTRRLLLGLAVIAGIVVLTFAISRLLPGDPAVAWAGPRASPEQIAQARHELGLDTSALAQLGRYFTGIATGDWGVSVHTKRPVLDDLATRLPASLELVLAALVLALAVGIPAGIVAAHRRGRAPDLAVRVIGVLGVSMPAFWLALILQMLFVDRLGLLPIAGQYDPALDQTAPLTHVTGMVIPDALLTGNVAVLQSGLEHLVLPMLVVAAYPTGYVARLVRATLLDVLGEDHVTLARATGFRSRTILGRLALKPALAPIVTVIPLLLAFALVNTFLVEIIFSWPGLGSYAAESISTLDVPAIVGVTLIVAIFYVVGNLVADLVQGLLDPRAALR